MKARVGPRPAADGPGHREAQEALPFLANRSLAGPALERVWSHVQGCAQCRADLALMHTWRHVLHAAPPVPGCDPERALAALYPALGMPAPPRATPDRPPGAPWRRAVLVVAFRPETPERDVRRILRACGARIVGGPTAGDAYLLDTDADVHQALASLHAERAVALAEPFAGDGRP